MKTIVNYFILMLGTFLFMNCSSDDAIQDTGPVYANIEDEYIPTEPISDGNALKMIGFPKLIKKYENDNLVEWSQYFYRPDGKLLKINFGHPQSGPELFTDTYHYDEDGKLIGLNGHDDYKFYWEKGNIVKAERYNGAWYGRIRTFYDYNTAGQIVKKTENYIDASFSLKNTYTYFEDGNLKKIEFYYRDSENEEFELYSQTSYPGYNEDINMFLEVVIIPGQVLQQHFPTSMSFKNFTDSSYDNNETYTYKYDTEGRVIEKAFGNNRIVYQYY